MVHSDASSVAAYLAELPESRRDALSTVLATVRKNILPGYEEVMNGGMISWQVPLAVEPETYNGQPLLFCALANQKRHMALYIMSLYCDHSKREKLLSAYEKLGKKANMGKSCLRFTKVENIPLAELGELIATSPMTEFVHASKRN